MDPSTHPQNDQPPVSTSLTISQIALSIALNKIGMREQGGPNMGPIVEWAIRPWSSTPAGAWAKWCAGFSCTCYLEAGSSLIRKLGSLSVPTLWKNMEQNGYAWRYLPTPGQKLPVPGDFVFLLDLNHIGLVERVDHTAVYTVEGNHNDQVSRVIRSLNSGQIYGFAHLGL